MKYFLILFTLLVFLFSQKLNAQFFENNSIYLSNEILFGNHLGIDVSLNWINKNKISIQSGYSGHISFAKSRPNDYTGGSISLFTLGTNSPSDKINTFFIKVGKVILLNEKETIRFNLMGGLGITSFREATNWQPLTGSNQGGFISGPNYTFDYQFETLLCVILNPKLEFPLSRVFGLNISPLVEISSKRVVWGIGVGTMVGNIKN